METFLNRNVSIKNKYLTKKKNVYVQKIKIFFIKILTYAYKNAKTHN